MSSPSMLQLLEGYLNVATTRQSLVVNNMANVDTPGYRTQDIDFKAELQRQLGGENAPQMPMIQNVSGLLVRPDGNNVDLDREGLTLAETQLQFRMGVQLLHTEFHRLLTAINGGNQS